MNGLKNKSATHLLSKMQKSVTICYTFLVKQSTVYFVVLPPNLVKTLSTGSQSSILFPSGASI